jgi:hypothetical protein
MEGHMNVLKIYGITEITTANTDWFFNPSVYVLLAEEQNSNQVLGGVRIHIYGGTQPLPIEDAISEMDFSIHEMVKTHALNGTGELCGLWNSREIAGFGISGLLLRSGVSVTNQLSLNSLFALCAPITVPLVGKYGFVIEKSLGKEGTFFYPKSDLLATAVIIYDLKKLEHSEKAEQSAIWDLQKNIIQTRIEWGPKGELQIEYNLKINSY